MDESRNIFKRARLNKELENIFQGMRESKGTYFKVQNNVTHANVDKITRIYIRFYIFFLI